MTDHQSQAAMAQGDEGVTTTEQQQQEQKHEQQVSLSDASNMSSDAVIAALEKILADVSPDLQYPKFLETSKGVNERIKATTTAAGDKHHLITAVGELARIAERATELNDKARKSYLDLWILCNSYFGPSSSVPETADYKILCDGVGEFAFAVAPRQTPSMAEVAGDDRYRSTFGSVSPDYARIFSDPYNGKVIITKAAVWDYLLSEFNAPSALWAGSIGLTYDRVRAHMGPQGKSSRPEKFWIMQDHCAWWLEDVLEAVDSAPGLDEVRKEIENERKRFIDGLLARFWPLWRDKAEITAATADGSDPKRQQDLLELARKREDEARERVETAARGLVDVFYDVMRRFRLSQFCLRMARVVDLPPLRPDGSVESDPKEGDGSDDSRVLFDPKRMFAVDDMIDARKGDMSLGMALQFLSQSGEEPGAKGKERQLAVELVVDPVLMKNGTSRPGLSLVQDFDSSERLCNPAVIVEGRVERFKAAEVPDYWAEWESKRTYPPPLIDHQGDELKKWNEKLKAMLKPEPESSQSQPEPESKSEPGSQSKPEPESSQSKPRPESSQSKPEPESSQSKPEPESQSKPESGSGSEPEIQSKSKPEVHSKPEPRSGSEPESGPESMPGPPGVQTRAQAKRNQQGRK